MKKIIILNGSRRKNGNTTKFINCIINKLPKNKYEVEWIFPQDYNIMPCTGCNLCFTKIKCILNDDIELLQNKILNSDLFIAASPVYIHYMTADLKRILDRISWWTHTYRLQGKPVIIISTCSSNGFDTVLTSLSNIITFMCGNVVAISNASELPNQINNNSWLDEVSLEISKRIEYYINIPCKSNKFIEKYFSNMKILMLKRNEFYNSTKEYKEDRELTYWKETGMLYSDSFENYLKLKYKKEEV